MKITRKLLAVLMVLMMLVPSISMIAQALNVKESDGLFSFDLDEFLEGQEGKATVKKGENGVDMEMDIPQKKNPLVYDKEVAAVDAGKNLSYVGNLGNTGSALYKVNNTSNVHFIEQDIEDTPYNRYLKAVNESKLMTDSEKKAFLKEADLRASGRADAVFEENKLDYVKFVNNTNDASAEIAVVDDTAIAFTVKDENDNKIKGAVVTLKYKDADGKDQERSSTTTDLGVVVFDNLSGTRFGAVDVQHSGHHSMTSFDVELSGGTLHDKVLVANKDNELYVRGADLDGQDMLDFSESLALVDQDDSLTYTVLVSKTGSKALPDSIELRAKNAGDDRSVAKFTKADSVYNDDNTCAYSCTDSWVKKDGILKAGDEPYYSLESAANGDDDWGTGYKVTDAKVSTPVWTGTSFSFLNGLTSFTFDDGTPGIGKSTVGVNAFKCPLQFGLLPDGTIFLSYGFDIVDEGSAEMMQGSWKPKGSEQAKSFFKKCSDAFQQKIEAFKEGKDIFVNSGNRTAVDYSTKFNVNISVTGTGQFDEGSGKVICSFGAIVAVTGEFGMTWYVLLPIGPAAIPAYAGFNASITGQVSGKLTFGFDVVGKTTAEDVLSTFQFINNDPSDCALSLDLILTVAAYVGVGIHDLACIQLNGSVYVDLGVDILTADMLTNKTDDPRLRISGGYSVGISATFLWFKYNKTLFADNGMIYDSYDSNSKRSLKSYGDDGRVQKIDTEAAENSNISRVSTGDGTTVYRLHDPITTNSENVSIVDSKTLNNSVPKVLETNGHTVLFRLMTINRRVHVVYQLLNDDGSLSTDVHVVDTISTARAKDNDVAAFDVAVSGTDKITVAQIAIDHSADSLEERMEKGVYGALFVDISSGTCSDMTVEDQPTDEFGEICTLYDIFAMSNGDFPNYIVERNTIFGGGDREVYINSECPYEWSFENMGEAAGLYSTDGHVFCLDDVNYEGIQSYKYVAIGKDGSYTYGYDFQSDTGEMSDSEPTLGGMGEYNGKLYLISNHKLQVMSDFDSKELTDLCYASGEPVKVQNTDAAYEFNKSGNGDVTLSGMAKKYDKDGNFSHNELVIYRIDKDNVVHGPQICRVEEENISSFSVVTDAKSGAPIIFYTKPLEESSTDVGIVDNAGMYEYQVPVKKELTVTSVAFTKDLLDMSDEYVPFFMTIKNTGTGIVESTNITVSDENGELLTTSASLYGYPGEETVVDMTKTPKPSNWQAGVHTVHIKTDCENSNNYSVTFDKPFVQFDATQKFVNGKHMAYVKLRNVSAVNVATPVVQVVGKFKSNGDKPTERVIDAFKLGTSQVTFGNFKKNGSSTTQSYNASFCLDDIWNKYNGTDDVLYSVTLRLAPTSVHNGALTGAEAERQLDMMPANVVFKNPTLSTNVKINATSNALIKGTVVGDGVYQYGKTVTLKAVPNAGHKFLGWYNGEELVSKDMEIKFNAIEKVNYVAKFAPTVGAVQVDDVKMNYKSTTMLNTVIDADDGTEYTVTYTSSNPNIVSVDVDGNVTGLKRGTTIVTCTVTDKFGNQIQDSCLVTVKYSPWQWIIKTVLFGWIWY